MKKIGKILLLFVATAMVLAVGTLALMYYVLQAPVFDRSGWAYTSKGVQYLDYYAKPLTGWQQVDGEEYYFRPNGNLATGLTKIDGKIYIFSPNGNLQKGWTEYGSDTYFLCDDGTVYTGWLEEETRRYYLNPEGILHTGWLDLEGKRYYLPKDGSIQTGWLDTDHGRFYLNSEGAAVTGWLQTDLARYYLDETGKMQTDFAEVAGVKRYFLSTGEYVPLVNLWNTVPADYSPKLTEFEDYQVDMACRDALEKMLVGCRAAGYECYINSAYRDVSKQQELWDKQYEKYIKDGKSKEEAKKLTGRRVAEPGTSEHHLGLAVDLGGSEGVYDWLEENCWRFGFIRRYPNNKTDVTGIIYEPWHYRYVGEPMAKAIFESNLTMEEYLDTLA